MRHLLLATTLIIGSQTAFADLPEPLKTAAERSDDGPNYVFDLERTSIQTGDNTDTAIGYARVDLSAPELKQITPLHLVDDTKPGSSFQALSEIENSIEDGIWCTRYIDNLPEADDIEIVAENDQTVTYEYTPKIDDDASGPEKKILKRTRARLTVSKEDPAIMAYEQSLTKTVTLYVVAKIRKVDTKATCARTPDGRTYVAETSSSFEASGFGDGGNDSQMRIIAMYDPETGEALPQGALIRQP